MCYKYYEKYYLSISYNKNYSRSKSVKAYHNIEPNFVGGVGEVRHNTASAACRTRAKLGAMAETSWPRPVHSGREIVNVNLKLYLTTSHNSFHSYSEQRLSVQITPNRKKMLEHARFESI